MIVTLLNFDKLLRLQLTILANNKNSVVLIQEILIKNLLNKF